MTASQAAWTGFQERKWHVTRSDQSEPLTPSPGDAPATPRVRVGNHHTEEPVSAVTPQPVEAPTPPVPGLNSEGKIPRTRIGAVWAGFIVAAVLLVALLIFIGQNLHTVAIHYLGFDGHVALAVALLMAAVTGVLVVAIPGTARILQLRRALKRAAGAAGAAANQAIRP